MHSCRSVASSACMCSSTLLLFNHAHTFLSIEAATANYKMQTCIYGVSSSSSYTVGSLLVGVWGLTHHLLLLYASASPVPGGSTPACQLALHHSVISSTHSMHVRTLLLSPSIIPKMKVMYRYTKYKMPSAVHVSVAVYSKPFYCHSYAAPTTFWKFLRKLGKMKIQLITFCIYDCQLYKYHHFIRAI